MDIPDYWINGPDDIKDVSENVKKGICRVLAKSQGGRDIYLVEYGEKQDLSRKANFASSLYYRDVGVYADKSGLKPIVLIVGATHGGEIEGITAVLNLIAELESGVDLRGRRHAWVRELKSNFRLLLIPCLNPDGRARVPFAAVPDDPKETVYYKHGEWKDGTPADYATGFRAHPIIDELNYMGGYYNDAGINPYADNYFSPASPEIKALFKLADEEAPDLCLFLHTGCHKHGKLLTPYYTPGFVMKSVMELDGILNGEFDKNGFSYYSLAEHGETDINDEIYPPPRFPLETAVYFSCGGLSVLYESNEARRASDNVFNMENILDCHFILFEQIFSYTRKYRDKCLEAGKNNNTKSF